MIDSFLNFDENRRDRLINEGFEEFSILGLERASLNKILSNSGISKGVFYHYFKNKEDFHLFLIKFCFNNITEALMDSSLLEITDLVERLIKSFVIKSQVYKKYHGYEKFISKIYTDYDKKYIETQINQESFIFGKRIIGKNINFDMFKTNDVNANVRVVSRYLHKTFTEIINSLSDLSLEEIEKYLIQEGQYLKKIVYKEEFA